MRCAYNTEEPTDYTSNKGREIKFRTSRPDQKFLKEVFMARIMAKTGEKEFPLPLHHVCKSHFLIDEDDPNCYFICNKCKTQIVADPRDLPKQCSICDSQNSFIKNEF